MAQSSPAVDALPQTNSLSQFYETADPAALAQCDKEPVHLIQAIQAQGAIIIISDKNQQILGYSANLTTLLGLAQPTVERPLTLTELLPDQAQEIMEGRQETSSEFHYALESLFTAQNNKTFQAIYHSHNDIGFLEFLPADDQPLSKTHQQLRRLRHHNARIVKADSSEQALSIATEAVQAITGFPRALIYQLQPDGSGKVVAESKTDHMPAFLGLFFPEKDIPKQIKHLMTLMPYRGVASADDAVSEIVTASMNSPPQQWDLTFSILRASSKIHTQYLRNMQVNSTLTLSLMHRGQLWGMLSCHHTDREFLPFDLWEALHSLGVTLMAKLEQEQMQIQHQMLQQLRQLSSMTNQHLDSQSATQEITGIAQQLMPPIRNLLNADGLACRLGTQLLLDGATPGETFINKLLDWASQHQTTDSTFATNALHSLWQDAATEVDNACGVLIEPVNQNRPCQLIWFRKHITKTVTWAGNPKPESAHFGAAEAVLMPRASFAAWVEEHQGMSDLWSEPDQTVAREVLRELLEIIITQERLTQSTKNMEAFSYAAAHDLRTPLRHIRAVLNMLREAHEYNTPTNTSTPSQTANPAQIADSPPTAIDGTDEVSNLLDIGLKSTDRLQRLVDNMMRFLVLNERDHESELISLTEVVKEAVDSLGDMIKSANAILNIDKHLPTVQGNQELITSVFTNLLENAIKYRDPSRPLTITIGTETRSGKTAIKISDNGIGIPQDQAKAVFEPFKRLHTHDQIAGSGLGLSICKRIIELHRATLEINPEHHPGTEFVLTLRTS